MPRPRSDIQSRIIRAARERFLRDGVDGASLRAIASGARTNIGMIYYYFPTKDDLFFAVVEQVYQKLLDELAKVLNRDLSVQERLQGLFDRLGELTNEELVMIQLVVREVLVSSSRLERLVQRFLKGHIPLVLETLFDGIRDGTFSDRRHPIVLMMSTFALGGPPQLIRRFLSERLPVSGVPSGKDLSREMLDILLYGVGGKALHDKANNSVTTTQRTRRTKP